MKRSAVALAIVLIVEGAYVAIGSLVLMAYSSTMAEFEDLPAVDAEPLALLANLASATVFLVAGVNLFRSRSTRPGWPSVSILAVAGLLNAAWTVATLRDVLAGSQSADSLFWSVFSIVITTGVALGLALTCIGLLVSDRTTPT